MVTRKRRTTPTPRKPTTIDTTPPVGPQVEFLNCEEDAWYNVQLVLEHDTLIVKYTEFHYENDVQFHAKDFPTFHHISMLMRRFRALSPQLESSDCQVVKEGMKVCALLVHSHDDRRFYDAIVEAVNREEHTVVDEKVNCSCTVVLSWLHGPNAGTLTTAKVEDLCLIQSHKPLDPRVACFLELAKWRHGLASPFSKLITKDITSRGESPTPLQCKPSVIQKSEDGKQMESAVPWDEEYFGHEMNEDIDLGGGDRQRQSDLYNLLEGVSINGESKDDDEEGHYFIMVENLEKDVSPSTIVEFVKEATGLTIEAFVFMSLSAEPYTRGALVADCAEDLERLCNFVIEPGQMITSSKGRPWIVSDLSASESVRPSFWCLEPDFKLQNGRQRSAGDGLKIVKLGSEEYCKAEKLRALYLEFMNHQQSVFERLVKEEQSIFNS